VHIVSPPKTQRPRSGALQGYWNEATPQHHVVCLATSLRFQSLLGRLTVLAGGDCSMTPRADRAKAVHGRACQRCRDLGIHRHVSSWWQRKGGERTIYCCRHALFINGERRKVLRQRARNSHCVVSCVSATVAYLNTLHESVASKLGVRPRPYTLLFRTIRTTACAPSHGSMAVHAVELHGRRLQHNLVSSCYPSRSDLLPCRCACSQSCVPRRRWCCCGSKSCGSTAPRGYCRVELHRC